VYKVRETRIHSTRQLLYGQLSNNNPNPYVINPTNQNRNSKMTKAHLFDEAPNTLTTRSFVYQRDILRQPPRAAICGQAAIGCRAVRLLLTRRSIVRACPLCIHFLTFLQDENLRRCYGPLFRVNRCAETDKWTDKCNSCKQRLVEIRGKTSDVFPRNR